jgi:ferredoxin
VVVCPAECFHEDDRMLYIDPDECTDCGACVAECPEAAIYSDLDLPAELAQWAAINARRAPQCPPREQK